MPCPAYLDPRGTLSDRITALEDTVAGLEAALATQTTTNIALFQQVATVRHILNMQEAANANG